MTTNQRTITVGELAADTLEAKAIWWLVEHEEARIICRGFTVTRAEAKGDVVRLEYRTLFPTYETSDRQCDLHFFKESGSALVQSQAEVDALRRVLKDAMLAWRGTDSHESPVCQFCGADIDFYEDTHNCHHLPGCTLIEAIALLGRSPAT